MAIIYGEYQSRTQQVRKIIDFHWPVIADN